MLGRSCHTVCNAALTLCVAFLTSGCLKWSWFMKWGRRWPQFLHIPVSLRVQKHVLDKVQYTYRATTLLFTLYRLTWDFMASNIIHCHAMPVSIAMKSRVDYRISVKFYIRRDFFYNATWGFDGGRASDG